MTAISTLAGIIQGEARSPADQFGVASTIQNRVNAGFPGSQNGALGVATAASQFSAYPNAMQTPTPYATSLATALVNGNLSDYGSTGNALYYNAPGYNSAYASGTANNFGPGSNQYSDQYNQPPSSNFQLPQLNGAQAGQPDYSASFGPTSLGPSSPSSNYGDITGYQVEGVNVDSSSIASQNDAFANTTLAPSQGSASVAAPQGLGPTDYPALNSQTSVTSNDQQFNQPDPSKVQVTDIASSGILGQEKVATATTGAGTAVQTGLNTAGQDVVTSEQQAVSGLGDLFARSSLVVIGLLLLAGAFVFYYMQHKDPAFGVKT